jgi:hypothetical protein
MTLTEAQRFESAIWLHIHQRRRQFVFRAKVRAEHGSRIAAGLARLRKEEL